MPVVSAIAATSSGSGSDHATFASAKYWVSAGVQDAATAPTAKLTASAVAPSRNGHTRIRNFSFGRGTGSAAYEYVGAGDHARGSPTNGAGGVESRDESLGGGSIS